MRGSIRRKGKGWQLRVYLGVDGTGVKRYRTQTVRGTKREAERVLRTMVDEVGPAAADGIEATFAETAKRWLAAADIAPSTRAGYRSYLDTWLLPALGDRLVHRVGAADLDRLYAAMRSAGASPSTVAKAHRIAARLLTQAVRWGWIARNPAADASPPAAARPDIVPPTPAEVRALIAAADEDFGPLLGLAAVTGARRGELAGLRWSDIDLVRGELTIRRSLTIDEAGRLVEKDTKTMKARTLAVDPEPLSAYRRRRLELAMRAGAGQPADDWVFSPLPDCSRPLRPDSITQHFDRLRRRVGLEGVRFHDLRHFAATQMLAAGIDVRTVAGRLGHARPSTTLDRYAAWLPARDRDAAEVLARTLSG